MMRMTLHIEPLIRNQRDKSTGRFIKGVKPWNKGIKHTAGGNSSLFRFKRGRLPHNTKPEGYEALRRDHSKTTYIYIKAGDRMRPKHRLIWEQHHGSIPKGFVIIFIDGNPMNCTIENLTMISRAENAIRNMNIMKRNDSIRKMYQREKIRKLYGMTPTTKHYKRIVNF